MIPCSLFTTHAVRLRLEAQLQFQAAMDAEKVAATMFATGRPSFARSLLRAADHHWRYGDRANHGAEAFLEADEMTRKGW